MNAVRLLLLLGVVIAVPVQAQNFPALTGRIVDEANIIPPDREAALSRKLEALETRTRRQFVVATVNGLGGHTIEDYGYRLGRRWGIGRGRIDDGLILLVAPIERETRIEVGNGLTPIVTDALAKVIIENDILPKFRENDMPGGIEAGADRLIGVLSLPDAQAEARAQRIVDEAKPSIWIVILAVVFGGGMVLLFVGYWLYVLWMLLKSIVDFLRRLARGERVINWDTNSGSGSGSGWSSGSSWSSSGSSSSSFSGGGGSFSGGGASGSW